MTLLFAQPRDLASNASHQDKPAAAAPHQKADAQTLDAIAALDHDCVWPTHRLRCFLQLQQSKALAGSR